ncbi:hypothetical protein Mth01_42300 [Sphaerimonospora thailandensis]|uniref:Uncharacterized protein n=1 Tax=Sphaerimonospora thailandensis TaxID=795644 RepID=A0A8J3RA72_9ACTN|nr:hypothetical protein Mth01_42300 [Sphaerimonospora thailandensis]
MDRVSAATDECEMELAELDVDLERPERLLGRHVTLQSDQGVGVVAFPELDLTIEWDVDRREVAPRRDAGSTRQCLSPFSGNASDYSSPLIMPRSL